MYRTSKGCQISRINRRFSKIEGKYLGWNWKNLSNRKEERNKKKCVSYQKLPFTFNSTLNSARPAGFAAKQV